MVIKSQHVIFYFSGTGNGLKAALTIARRLENEEALNGLALGAERAAQEHSMQGMAQAIRAGVHAGGAVPVIDLANKADDPTEASAPTEPLTDVRVVCMGPDEPFAFEGPCRSIGFVYPCHFGTMPQRVREFASALDLSGQTGAYRYAVVTYGGGVKNPALAELNSLLAKKGCPLDYSNAVKAFSTYVILYKMSEKVTEKTARFKYGLEFIVDDVCARRKTPTVRTGAFDSLYTRLAMKNCGRDEDRHFVVSESCDGCSVCAAVCPVDNIRIEGGRPAWLHRCEQCLGCLHLCPRVAIDFGAKTKGRGRYKHPEVTVHMLIAYNNNHPETLGHRY
ncbi:MAG: EFR1 family ferrodoxin [Coriobacteriales bacterium]|nr:EFR1 family ferrodoxin [Coriobacteriales bacterium]